MATEERVTSKGIKLSYGTGDSYTELKDLQEIPSLGGSQSSIEVTTLADAAHVYVGGLLDFGESLDFKFIYAKEQFIMLSQLEGTYNWKVELRDGTTCVFSGTCSVSLDGVGTNAALTYVLSIKPNSEMVFA